MQHGRFERDTAVTATTPGRFTGVVDDGWAVIDGAAPNGGYLMAMAARAMRADLPHPDPVTVTAHFLAPPEPGEVSIAVDVLRRGRRHSTVTARVEQDGRCCLGLIGTFGDLARADGVSRMDRSGLTLPPIEACVDARQLARERAEAAHRAVPPIVERFDHRQPAEVLGWSHGQPTGQGEMGGYLRWADGAPMDTLGLLVVADCLPPAVFNTGESGLGWVPTIELTVQVRRPPTAGYLTAWFTTEAVTNGYLEEDGEVWDADGELVALSRQLALAPR